MTAVEWLAKEIEKTTYLYDEDKIAIEQAKKMEKEQERMYSEEEVKEILTKCTWILTESKLKWFEQFKKK